LRVCRSHDQRGDLHIVDLARERARVCDGATDPADKLKNGSATEKETHPPAAGAESLKDV